MHVCWKHFGVTSLPRRNGVPISKCVFLDYVRFYKISFLGNVPIPTVFFGTKPVGMRETQQKHVKLFFFWVDRVVETIGLPSCGSKYPTVLYTSPQEFVHINCVWRHQSWIGVGFCDMYSASFLAWFLVSDCCLNCFPSEPLRFLQTYTMSGDTHQ